MAESRRRGRGVKPQDILSEFEHDGRYWFRHGLSEQELAVLDSAANLDEKAGERIEPKAALLDVLSGDGGLGRIMRVFEQPLVPVRVVAFNKTRKNNWGVPWHQDRVICVSERHEVPDFRNWSRKSGVWHCEPPTDILDRMYFVRVHLDNGEPENGVMRIAAGSHKEGIVSSATARSAAERYPIEECTAVRGDVLVLKMLTLHSSSPSTTTHSRRVFRVDYASAGLLPTPLSWHGLSTMA